MESLVAQFHLLNCLTPAFSLALPHLQYTVPYMYITFPQMFRLLGSTTVTSDDRILSKPEFAI